MLSRDHEGDGRGVGGGKQLAEASEEYGNGVQRPQVVLCEEECDSGRRPAHIGQDEQAPLAPAVDEDSGEDSEDHGRHNERQHHSAGACRFLGELDDKDQQRVQDRVLRCLRTDLRQPDQAKASVCQDRRHPLRAVC